MTTDAASPAPSLHPQGLAALEQRLARDLECFGWPARAWMPARTHGGEPVLDVAIIGAGQAGLAAAAALAQQGIRAVVFDRSPAG
ncbi:MAG: NAD(P)-binding protein, partial [Variovorax paradoxus]